MWEPPDPEPSTAGAHSELRRIGPPAAGVMEREVGGCVVLLPPNQAEVLVLNETASDVWRLVDGELTLSDMVSLLAQAYGVEPLSICDDVTGTIRRFEENGLFAVSQ